MQAADANQKVADIPGAATGRPERPIQSSGEDQLERAPFIRRLTQALINPRTGHATGVVIGVTGPWGSGKSSILNLLAEHIKSVHEQSIVIRFDPWLISGRMDLITGFIRELIKTMKSAPRVATRLKGLVKTFGKYGESLAPAAIVWHPIVGTILKGASTIVREVTGAVESPLDLRAQLTKQLQTASIPIVVLIDELDRVEDEEIRTVAQLVRSVADFPGISYVLAYDTKRVVEALGSGGPEATRDERGRAYLEKIVQLQIPLPVTLDEELARMLAGELRAVQEEVRIGENFDTAGRFQEVRDILFSGVIRTPRDINRLLGTFHVVVRMVKGEVDWIDLLAYCALLTKAPQTTELIKLNPQLFSDEFGSVGDRMLAASRGEKNQSSDEDFRIVLPQSENYDGVRKIITFLFPSVVGRRERSEDSYDRLCRRRPLLTTLRLGLLPGAYSRDEIEGLLSQSREGVAEALRKIYDRGAVQALIDRLDDLSLELNLVGRIQFWFGVGQFLRKPDCEWMTGYSPMSELARTFAELLETAIIRDPSVSPKATSVFTNLRNQGENELTAIWLRRHIFAHGLFGWNKRERRAQFLNAAQTEALAREMTIDWLQLHRAGKLIPCRWDLIPVYTMIDTGVWDDLSREAVNVALADDRAVDGLTLMFFGSMFTTDNETVEKICSRELYLSRVKQRMSSDGVSASALIALRKATGDGS